MRVALVAGETSGDLLGGGLLQALRRHVPNLEAYGIAGKEMQTAGCKSLYPMDRLSVMGLFEALGRLPELLRIRSQLRRQLLAEPPDLFVGIDAPDFNLPLARSLKAAGIPTVQYVSPSVWAWRRYRVKKIAQSVDLMLVLFPFEAKFYKDHAIAVEFVGHPLADMIAESVDKLAARETLGLPPEAPLVALLPGSRQGEVERHGAAMVAAAKYMRESLPEVSFCAPFTRPALAELFRSQLQQQDFAQAVTIFDGRSRLVMSACDVVLLSSGTATLEAMLLKKPMVVTYIANSLSYRILKPWLSANISFLALPNLLADRALVPEVLQHAVTPQSLAAPLLAYLTKPQLSEQLIADFTVLHQSLKRDASERSAKAILNLLQTKTRS